MKTSHKRSELNSNKRRILKNLKKLKEFHTLPSHKKLMIKILKIVACCTPNPSDVLKPLYYVQSVICNIFYFSCEPDYTFGNMTILDM
jgi:hypothetical protein